MREPWDTPWTIMKMSYGYYYPVVAKGLAAERIEQHGIMSYDEAVAMCKLINAAKN